MEVADVIERLERELDVKQGLFSKKIDIDNCMELLEQLKKSVSERVGAADKIVETRKHILQNADKAAKNTIKEAEKRAEHTMGTHELLCRAEREADGLIEAAYAQSEGIVKRTKDHLDLMFKDVEDFLLSNLAMIRKNRDELRCVSFVYNDKAKF